MTGPVMSPGMWGEKKIARESTDVLPLTSLFQVVLL